MEFDHGKIEDSLLVKYGRELHTQEKYIYFV